jgi:NAD(P)H-flavin reductase
MAESIQQAEVTGVRDITPHVREIVIFPLERRVGYQPGQWISIKVPMDYNPPLNRAYSMAEPEEPSGRLLLVFDRVPDGIGSEYLYSLNAGDRLSFSGPHGKFLLPQERDKSLLLIGRYTGMVPIRCIVKALMSAEPATSLTLISTAPSEDELLYQEEFAALAATHADIHYVPIAGSPDLEIERVTEAISTRIGARGDVVPMICGLKRFVRPLRAFFMERGFDRRDVKVETYD